MIPIVTKDHGSSFPFRFSDHNEVLATNVLGNSRNRFVVRHQPSRIVLDMAEQPAVCTKNDS